MIDQLVSKLVEYEKKRNRKSYVPLDEGEVRHLQNTGLLTKHKVPKITEAGYFEIAKGRRLEREDILRELDEAGLTPEGMIKPPSDNGIWLELRKE